MDDNFERITRYLIDSPNRLKKLIRKRNRADVQVNEESLRVFKELTKGVKVLRSLELVAVAFENGLLDRYVSERELKEIPDLKKQFMYQQKNQAKHHK